MILSISILSFWNFYWKNVSNWKIIFHLLFNY